MHLDDETSLCVRMFAYTQQPFKRFVSWYHLAAADRYFAFCVSPFTLYPRDITVISIFYSPKKVFRSSSHSGFPVGFCFGSIFTSFLHDPITNAERLNSYDDGCIGCILLHVFYICIFMRCRSDGLRLVSRYGPLNRYGRVLPFHVPYSRMAASCCGPKIQELVQCTSRLIHQKYLLCVCPTRYRTRFDHGLYFYKRIPNVICIRIGVLVPFRDAVIETRGSLRMTRQRSLGHGAVQLRASKTALCTALHQPRQDQ
jgi:hypothetical protein